MRVLQEYGFGDLRGDDDTHLPIAEYRDELNGTKRDNGFEAALKAYRKLDDEWYDYSPRGAADVLEPAWAIMK